MPTGQRRQEAVESSLISKMPNTPGPAPSLPPTPDTPEHPDTPNAPEHPNTPEGPPSEEQRFSPGTPSSDNPSEGTTRMALLLEFKLKMNSRPEISQQPLGTRGGGGLDLAMPAVLHIILTVSTSHSS